MPVPGEHLAYCPAERPGPDSDVTAPSGQLTAAEGEALRALRAIIFDHDPLRAFGRFRRVQAPSGDLLWVCENHYPDYDPGLPARHPPTEPDGIVAEEARRLV